MALGHFSIAVVCLLFLVSCAKPPREAVKKEPENLDPKVALATLVEAWQSGDTTRLADLLDDGSVYVDIPNDATYKGVDGFKGYVDHVHAWASGTKMVVDLSVVGETSAVAGWT
ncbi:MAG TPA: nuclear transport factor 2 family protein, partial [Fimbriimonadaceae bacterium]|nr:nuclear transport factor 2 family protein [Fimbriimonadaceae bacterium]